MKRGDQPVNVLLSVYWKKHPEICGLTVRELAAIAAMTGLLANPRATEVTAAAVEIFGGDSATIVTRWACNYADELLDQLAKGDEDEEADQDEVVAP